MKSEQLHQVREACKEQLLQTLTTLVQENGVDYCDYFRDEHGIEEDEGYTIGKCFDIASFGCHMALPLKWCDGLTADVRPLQTELGDEFGYHAYWSLYIERDQTGYETLMLYQFCCPGVCWDNDEAEPDHQPASEMSLAELATLFTQDKVGGDTLTYRGEAAMEQFKRDWCEAIREKAKAVLPQNILEMKGRYDVGAVCNETHLRTGYRFKIEDWNGDYADTPAELICYVASKMKEGDKLYIGAVIDFHY